MIPSKPVAEPGAIALLAEDDEMIREIVAQYLEALGYSVLLAKDGRAAIEIMQSRSPHSIDLVVTDLLMPYASGDKVVKAAREREACNRFLVISGFALKGYDAQVEPSDTLAYLEKPFNFQTFQAMIGQLCSRPN